MIVAQGKHFDSSPLQILFTHEAQYRSRSKLQESDGFNLGITFDLSDLFPFKEICPVAALKVRQDEFVSFSL